MPPGEVAACRGTRRGSEYGDGIRVWNGTGVCEQGSSSVWKGTQLRFSHPQPHESMYGTMSVYPPAGPRKYHLGSLQGHSSSNQVRGWLGRPILGLKFWILNRICPE